MKFEYSQSIIFNIENFEVVADITPNRDINTNILFKDSYRNQEFVDICKSWGLFDSILTMLDDGSLEVSGGQKAYDSNIYAKFMEIIISYLEGDFKLR